MDVRVINIYPMQANYLDILNWRWCKIREGEAEIEPENVWELLPFPAWNHPAFQQGLLTQWHLSSDVPFWQQNGKQAPSRQKFLFCWCYLRVAAIKTFCAGSPHHNLPLRNEILSRQPGFVQLIKQWAEHFLLDNINYWNVAWIKKKKKFLVMH